MNATTPLMVWLPVAVVLVGVVVGLVGDSLGKRAFGRAAIIATLLTAGALSIYAGQAHGAASAFGDIVVLGGGLSTLAGFGYLLAGVSVLAGWDRAAASSRSGTVAALIALGAAAVQVLGGSFDLLLTVLALEAVALVGYALVSSAGNGRSDEAAMRYFVQGGTATGFTVLGLAVMFGLAGYTGYVDFLGVVQGGGRAITFAMVLVLSAFAFKLGAFPFHSWAPDVFETSEPSSAAFLASVPKIGALMAVLLIFPGGVFTADVAPGITLAMSVLAAGSVVAGNLGALRQSSLGRMLGYSAIAQVGYGLTGVASGMAGVTPTAVFAVTYALGVAAAFVVAEAIRVRRPEWDGSIKGLGGLASESPLLAAAMTAAVLSLTGMPLFAGFWGKLLVFSAAVTADLTWLAVVGVIGSVVSFGYYGKVIRAMYGEGTMAESDTAGEPDVRAVTGAASALAARICAAAVIVVGLWPLAAGVDVLYKLIAF